MATAPRLNPNALVTVSELRDRLKKHSGVGEEQVVIAANVATAICERVTNNRRLRERVYMRPVQLAITVSSGAAAVTGTGFTAAATLVRAGCDVVGPAMAYGARVLAVASNTALTLTLNAEAAAAGAAHAFGSETMFVDGDGTNEFLMPEWPVSAVYSMGYRDSEAVLWPLDITNIGIDNDAGIITLPRDSAPRGRLNVEIEALAGYRPRSASDLGHDEFYDLQRLCFGVAEILFAEYQDQMGAMSNYAVGGQSASRPDIELPKKLLNALRDFERVD